MYACMHTFIYVHIDTHSYVNHMYSTDPYLSPAGTNVQHASSSTTGWNTLLST